MNLRTINLNGYIDEEVFYGDEITPAMLHDVLYGENSEFSDDVRIILNSYGGSCNAAVRMHDDIRAYPGKVHLPEFIYSTYNSLLESGWRMDEIDRMDMPGFLKIRAWNAKQEQKKKEPRQRYIDEVWSGLKP